MLRRKKMKKTTAAIIVLLCISMFTMVLTQTKASPAESPLEIAEKAATWVISKAENGNPGYKWQGWFGYYNPTFQWGAPGIGTFLLELYDKTNPRNQTYLDYAIGAGDWVLSKAVPAAGGYQWPHYDQDNPTYGWRLPAQENGAAGIGDFLLKLYKEIGNATYLSYAEGAARWMISLQTPEGYIEYPVPAPGPSPARESMTATFMLHVGKEVGNDTYLKVAEDSAQWLINTAIADNGGYKWINNNLNHYEITDAYLAAAFLYETYESTGNLSYLQYANGAIQWVLSQAVVNGSKAKWPSYQGGTDYPIISSGGEGRELGKEFVGDVLLEGYTITHNATYLDYANKQAEWIISQGIQESGGLERKFPETEGGTNFWSYTSARVFRFLQTMYSETSKESYLSAADQTLAWIVQNAVQENNGYKWTFYGESTPGFDGASGIGYNLITATALWTPPAPLQLAITLGGDGLDYSHNEKTRVKITALVTYADAPQPVPGANVTIKIRDPKNNVWVFSNMTEIDNGIFAWESNETVNQIFSHGGDGVYIAYAEVSKEGYLNGSSICAFHIDPPPNEATGDSGFLIMMSSAIALIAAVAITLAYVKKKRYH
jgi:rhamnogalacturonyl hydrolase YesR